MDLADAIALRSQYLLGWSGSLISSYIAITIYGVTLLQLIYYFMHYDRDRLLWKLLVFAVFALDTASLVLFLYCLYYYLIISWGPPDGSGYESGAYPAEFCISAIMVVMIQGFYINCLHTLNSQRLIVIALAVLSLVSFAFGLAMVPLYSPMTFNENAKRIGTVTFSVMLYISRGSALACDIGIVAAFWVALGGLKAHSRRISAASAGTMQNSRRALSMRFWKSDGFVNAILALTVERGVMLAIIQAAELIAYSVQPCTMFFVPFHIIAIRVYSTSLLVTLNGRNFINGLTQGRRRAGSATLVNTDTSPNSPPILRIERPSPYGGLGGDDSACNSFAMMRMASKSNEPLRSGDDVGKYDTLVGSHVLHTKS